MMAGAVVRCPSSKAELRQCGYHWGPEVDGCRVVQLRGYYGGRIDWDSPMWVCPSCREYLRGLFRYVKPVERGLEPPKEE